MSTYVETTVPSTGAYVTFARPIGVVEVTPPSTGAYTAFDVKAENWGGWGIGMSFGRKGQWSVG